MNMVCISIYQRAKYNGVDSIVAFTYLLNLAVFFQFLKRDTAIFLVLKIIIIFYDE